MHRLAFIVTSLFIVAPSGGALAQSWSVQVLPGTEGSATGINDLGVIVGALKTGLGYEAVKWTPPSGPPTPLAVPPGSVSYVAKAINDAGDVVGEDGFGLPTVWNAGVPTQLPFLPNGDIAKAEDINAAGEIAGWGTGSGPTGGYAIRWMPSGPVELPRPNGASTCQGAAINDAGDIIGYCNMNNGSRAVVWIGSTPLVLGMLSTATASNAYDLDDSGRVVGYSYISSNFAATRWTDGVPKRLEKLLQTKASIATAIGSTGRMVGWTSLKSGVIKATTWLNLNSAIALPTAPGTNHCIAHDIDSAETIVGYCYNANIVPFVWVPVKWVKN